MAAIIGIKAGQKIVEELRPDPPQKTTPKQRKRLPKWVKWVLGGLAIIGSLGILYVVVKKWIKGVNFSMPKLTPIIPNFDEIIPKNLPKVPKNMLKIPKTPGFTIPKDPFKIPNFDPIIPKAPKIPKFKPPRLPKWP